MLALLLAAGGAFAQPKEPVYVRKETRAETIKATLRANGLPALDGKWYWVGPFDNTGGIGFRKGYPPEQNVDLKQTFLGKRNREIRWREFEGFELGKVVNLARFPDNQDSCVYLYHEFEVRDAVTLPLSLGS
ncbi:MAG TPA: hypothetical protein VIL46_16305, partial [Gemmataceae bacterium]